jgi:hypothetical protein
LFFTVGRRVGWSGCIEATASVGTLCVGRGVSALGESAAPWSLVSDGDVFAAYSDRYCDGVGAPGRPVAVTEVQSPFDESSGELRKVEPYYPDVVAAGSVRAALQAEADRAATNSPSS